MAKETVDEVALRGQEFEVLRMHIAGCATCQVSGCRLGVKLADKWMDALPNVATMQAALKLCADGDFFGVMAVLS